LHTKTQLLKLLFPVILLDIVLLQNVCY